MSNDVEQMSLRCRKCGSLGTAIWENIAPDLSHGRRLVSLSEGFYQRPLLGADQPEIICDHCGTGQRH
jgi:hypothetical protein